MTDILLLNGPNLNLLGQREPEIYGDLSLEAIENACKQQAVEQNLTFNSFQSNSESDLVERIQQAKSDKVQLIVINPAAYTHTSVAIRDALLAVEIPFIEVHLSNPYSREPFRHHSYFSDIAMGTIAGFGIHSYRFAMQAAIDKLTAQ
ncbi:type II 3-dehydroquinate dehydratase [Kangiella sp. HZ709]|uniref:type II 3-dehydroquinate dehydratase n=1 Tax=Kangiella sp. HZ709 TaxID=2666328 RepID=UPI0012AF788F|nr:type II 3-dehydroquinate dehydratase [Kangiella sp. HZ709]MRX28145.1 type II 3-dehydroquinate dehydratase [Kangiella sp. HZ709]